MSKSAAATAASLQTERSRHLGRDLAGIALAAVTLFLATAVLSYDPGDPVDPPVWPLSRLFTPDTSVYPGNDTIHNACGYWGALFAAALLEGIGLAAGFVIAGIGGLAVALIMRGGVQAVVLRSLGGTLVLIAVSTAAAMFPWQPSGFPAIGAGGHLGAMTSLWLAEHFATLGGWILTCTVLAFGTLLTTDYVLLQAGQKALRGGAQASAKGIRRVRSALPQRPRQPFTDGAENADEVIIGRAGSAAERETVPPAASSEEPPIRIRGRGVDEIAEAAPESTPAAAPPTVEAGPEATLPAADERTAEEADEATDAAIDEDDEQPASSVRTVEVDGEEKIVRQDQAHPAPNIRVKAPKKPQDERQQVFDQVQEDLPEGVDQYALPSLELLTESDDICYDDQLREVRRKAKILEETFRHFGFNIRVVEIETGPVIAQYEVELEAGLRLSKITGLADDLAIALRVPSVRIVAPIPGKNTLGIEVPNETRQVVRLREVIEEASASVSKMNIPVFLGKDVSGNPLTVDLAKMPHLLIAGRTGTGKSVCLNAIISSILMTCRPAEVRMLMIDPKMVELSGYGRLPHLMHPVITDMKKAEAILAWAVEKMEERYSLLAKVGVRHINGYNNLGREELARRLEIDDEEQEASFPDHLPFIVIVADEMADLMMTAGKDVEQHIIRLAQKSRAVGIHLILATQKPTVDVITGLIKSNLPARLSFQVASKTDSRVVLDENGAEKLLGNGDMLFLWPGTSTLLRGQGTYLGDEEIERVCDHCSHGEQNFVGELLNMQVQDDDEQGVDPSAIKKRDALYESAVDVVVREGRGSCSLLQRCLGIGYGRAARLIDYMAEDKIVGEYNGSQARDVLLTVGDWEAMQGIESSDDEEDLDADAETASPEHRPPAASDSGLDPSDDQWEDVD